jgi:CRP/FNR family transcriptional regulator, dissimilatory nitrate respiration regulator
MKNTGPTGLDWDEVERRLPVLAAFPGSARESARVEKLDAGEWLFLAGATPSAMFFVLSGEVRLVRSSRSGAQIVLQRTRHGILAEASLDQAAYHCDAIASIPATVLRVPRNIVRQALEEEHFAAAWRSELSRELRRLRAQCERLSLNSARERIIHYIETEGDRGALTLTQTKKQWATELGLTHETLYRTLSQMTKSGSIRIEGKKIRLSRDDGQRV